MTAWTKLSEAGGVVCVSGRADEKIITGKADGSAKAGYLVSVMDTGTLAATSGDIKAIAVAGDATDWFTGILLEKYNTDCDAAVADGDLVEIVIPRGGHLYNVAISAAGATYEAGDVLDFPAADAGKMAVQGAGLEDNDYWAILTQQVTATSEFAEVVFV